MYLALTLVAKNIAMTEQERHLIQKLETAGCHALK